MKKIGEMTLEELQDYALQLEGDKATLEAQITEKDTSIKDLTDTNLMLQQRNNKLFMQVEQGQRAPENNEPEKVETCEEFALNKMKGIIK